MNKKFMKHVFRTFGLMMLMWGLNRFPGHAQNKAGDLKIIKTNVSIRHPQDKDWKDAIEGAIFQGDDIRTGKTGISQIEFVEGFSIKIFPRSTFTVAAKPKVNKGKINVKTFKKLLNPVEIATPSAIVGVRGTEFDLEVSETGSSFLEVHDGTVWLTTRGKETIVSTGEKAIVTPEGEVKKIEKEQTKTIAEVTFHLVVQKGLDIARWQLKVTSPEGAILKTWGGGGSPPENVVWKASDPAGNLLPAGGYTASFSVETDKGKTQSVSKTFTVQEKSPGIE